MANHKTVRYRIAIFALATLILSSSTACKREQLEEFAKSVQETAGSAVAQTVKATTAGSIKLHIENDFQSSAANARLISIGDGRSNVLQIRSYDQDAMAGYPSILVQANTNVSQLNALAGQTLTATVYATESKYLPIWSCQDQTVVTVQIESSTDGVLKAKIVSGEVISTEEKRSPITGVIEANYYDSNASQSFHSTAKVNPIYAYSPSREVRQ